MRALGSRLSPLLAIFVVLVRAETASACGATPCAFVRDVQPADGAAGVPRNAEIRVRYFGSLDAAPLECGADLARVRLTAEGADTEELGGDLLVWPERAEGWLVVKPPEPLLPETRYELALRASLGDACSCDSVWTTVSSFETGAASDVRAPALSGSREASYGDRETSTNNCGTMDGVPLVTVLGLADDFQGARYNIYVDGELTSPYRDRVTANAEGAEIYVDCGTTALSTATRVEPGAKVEIRAVDLAGNESAPGDALSVPDKCAQSSGSDSGCSLSASHPGSWLDGFWSVALLAGLARRLRSPRQQTQIARAQNLDARR